MKAILIKDVDKLGKEGDLVNVKPGYFNNYLEKNGLAIKATPDVVKQWKNKKKEEEKREREEKEEAIALKEKMEALEVNVSVKSGEGGRLFGSITSQDIADALKDQHGIEMDKKKIELDENIKNIGTFPVDVRVYPDMLASLKVNVKEA